MRLRGLDLSEAYRLLYSHAEFGGLFIAGMRVEVARSAVVELISLAQLTAHI